MASSGYFQIGVIATADGLTTGVIYSGTSFVQISICESMGFQVTLPSDQPNGTVIRIRNDGENYCLVVPQQTGAINSLPVGIGFPISQYGGSADFIAAGHVSTTHNQWYTFGDGTQWIIKENEKNISSPCFPLKY